MNKKCTSANIDAVLTHHAHDNNKLVGIKVHNEICKGKC